MKRIIPLPATLAGALATPAAAAPPHALGGSNQLVVFDSVTPTAAQTATPITGLQAGDAVVSLDVRPAGGELYGVAVNGSNAGLYRIDPATAAATLVGPGPFSSGIGST